MVPPVITVEGPALEETPDNRLTKNVPQNNPTAMPMAATQNVDLRQDDNPGRRPFAEAAMNSRANMR